MRSFLENNSVVDAATERTASQFTWQPGDVQMLPMSGSIFTAEDFKSQAAQRQQQYYHDLVNRSFPVRKEHGSAPYHIPLHPDELANQIAHRQTYHRGGGYNSMTGAWTEPPEHTDEGSKTRQSMITAHSNYKGSSSFYNQRLRHPNNFKGDHIALETTDKDGYHDGGYPRSEMYHHLDAVTKHPTIRPMSLYRGYGRGLDLRKLAPGHEFIDHGYTGLSHRRAMAEGYTESNYGHVADPLSSGRTIAMVHIPAGTYGHSLDLHEHGGPHLTSLEEEQEFLLHRGTKFRVMGHSLVTHGERDHGGYARTHVTHLQVVGQHPLPLVNGKEADERNDY